MCMCVSCRRFIDIVFICNNKLYCYDYMLLCRYGIFNNFYRADDVFIQAETPQNLIGKVIAVILTVSMCAQPLGNVFYGVLFEICKGYEYAVILFSGTVSLMIGINARNIFKRFWIKQC